MKTPFGNTVAAIKLAEMVENNPRARRYIGSILSELGNVLRELMRLETPTRRYLNKLIRNAFVKKADQCTNLSTEAQSFLKNVIVAKCRTHQRYADESQI